METMLSAYQGAVDKVDAVSTPIAPRRNDATVELLDTRALDLEIESILYNQDVMGDEKWLLYNNALERYLFKCNPAFKARQLEVVVHEGNNNDNTVAPRSKVIIKGPKKFSVVGYLPFIIGPAVSTAAFLCSGFL